MPRSEATRSCCPSPKREKVPSGRRGTPADSPLCAAHTPHRAVTEPTTHGVAYPDFVSFCSCYFLRWKFLASAILSPAMTLVGTSYWLRTTNMSGLQREHVGPEERHSGLEGYHVLCTVRCHAQAGSHKVTRRLPAHRRGGTVPEVRTGTP